jgi:hypothetical protein
VFTLIFSNYATIILFMILFMELVIYEGGGRKHVNFYRNRDVKIIVIDVDVLCYVMKDKIVLVIRVIKIGNGIK